MSIQAHESAVRIAKAAALLAALVGLGGLVARQARFSQKRLSHKPDYRAIPATGLAEYNTHGKVPGNPTYAAASMKRIYKMVGVFRRRNGVYPRNMVALMSDATRALDVYGFSAGMDGIREMHEILDNADYIFDDSASTRQGGPRHVMYYISDRRPDGAPIGGPVEPGQRDVIAWTDTYFHRNIVRFPDGHDVSNPVGFFLVLWSDGKVDRIPYSDVLFAPTGPSSFVNAFPGQAGLPKLTLTYSEFNDRFKRRGSKRPK